MEDFHVVPSMPVTVSLFVEYPGNSLLFLHPTVLSSQNFVGKWKYCSPGAQWEGIWSLCKAGYCK
jgi:hypothetical protein